MILHLIDFECDGKLYRLDPALELEVGYTSTLCTARSDDYGLDCTGRDEDELADNLLEELALNWREYVLDDAAKLSPKALELRERLMKRVVRVDMLVALEEATKLIADLEARAGVPRPCPRCGAMVFHVHNLHYSESNVRCNHCEYRTITVKDWQDAWREHEQNCREAEEKVDGPCKTL